jgi:glycosyltransferase involved in cell wall biosynthesis
MKKTICLNMIVKNESRVIQRCLTSVRNVIDSWVIVDTGSTDGTQELIRDFLRDLPGELHERPWVDFAHNRNEALALAKGKGDYLLFIDADEVLEFLIPEPLPCTLDIYLIKIRYGGNCQENFRNFLINNHKQWTWKGVVHEEINPVPIDDQRTGGYLTKARILYGNDGYRSKDGVIKKALHDAAVLKQALQKDPTNANIIYYLAQSYDVGRELTSALNYYEQRARIPKEGQGQLFLALLRIGVLQNLLGYDPSIYVQSYIRAYLHRPLRAEPLYHLANHFLDDNKPFLTFLVASFALTLPFPKYDPALVDLSIYDYRLLLQVAYSSCAIKRYEETRNACLQLRAKTDLSAEQRAFVEQLLAEAQASENV